MKKNVSTTVLICSTGLLFLFAVSTGRAQTYFAGSNAGAGNTGIMVAGAGSVVLSNSNSGSGNSGFGAYALKTNTAGIFNSAFGAQALERNTLGSNNTAAGRTALFANTLGNGNTAIGYNTLAANTTGDYNIALGENALSGNTTASANIAIGKSVLRANQGIYNTAIGSYSCYNSGSGDYNASLGAYGLYSNINGSANTSIGYNSLFSSVSGSNNVAVGANTGNSYSSYTRCTFLGNSADASVNGLSNATAIGNAATVDASNKVVIGNTAVTSIGGWAGWTNLSDRRLKSSIKKSELGLGFILSLNPVTYYYTVEGQKNILQTGLIAQEVDEAAKKQGVDFSAVDKSGEYWGLRYATLTVPLIKAIQEMEANHMAEKEMLNNRIEKLEAAIASLQQKQFPETKSVSLQSILFQNQPNPFNQSAVIRYSLKAGDEKAAIVIRDLNGKVIKQFAVASSANSYITVNGNELAPGTYTYTLIINGMAADTKLMVIAK